MSEENKGDFMCDECKAHFYVGQGFLGSLSDFEFQMNEGDVENQEQFECSPFMNYVQLCNSCLTSKQNQDESNNQ